MKTSLIFNPNAGSAADVDQIDTWRAEQVDLLYWETEGPGDATRLAQRAVEEGCDGIIVAGGDGTINEVVNGLMQGDLPELHVAILPLGTGNDLSRMLDVPAKLADALDLLETGEERRLDVIEVARGEDRRFAVNACAGGFSGQVDEALTSEMKKQWGPLSYLFVAASEMSEMEAYDVRLTYDDGEEQRLEAYNVIVANGRTIGGGNRVAPAANPEDGLLDVVVMRAGPVTAMAELGARLLAGVVLDSEYVWHHRVKTVRVEATPGMPFNVDGELFTDEPLTFSVRPGALWFVVGPRYSAVPES